MNPNTNEPMNRTTLYVVLVIIIVLLIGAIFASRAHAPGTETVLPVTEVASSTLGGLNLGSSSPSLTTSTNVSTTTKVATAPAKNATFTSPGWSIAVTLRPQWNVNEILNGDPTKGTGSLHQMTISDSQTVIFISQNEAVAVSGDLASTTSTQTIAGQSVTVRTYTKPNAQFAFYKIFTLKESDATYSFLIKSAVADTSVTDAFIRSISHA